MTICKNKRFFSIPFFDFYYLDEIVLVGDFNGDGRSDIFMPQRGKIFFSNGTPNPVEYTLPNFIHQRGYTYSIGDFNGDGKDEFIYTHDSLPKMTLYRISPHEQSYLAQVIMDGFNRKTELEYKPLTKGDVYTKGTTLPAGEGTVNFQAPLHVVSKMSAPNGIGGKSSVSFLYENAKVHKRGKGFLAFAKMTSISTVNDLKTVNEYGYDSTLFNSYLKQTTTMLNSNSSEIQKITHTNKTYNSFSNNKIILPYIEKTVKEDLLASTKIVDSLAYDFANGNLKFQETRYIDVSEGGGSVKSDIETLIYTETATYTYQKRGSPPNDYECLLKKLTTTGKHTNDGNKVYSRFTDYGYDPKGNLKRTVADNGVIAHYVMDNYGFVSSKIDTIPDIGVITNSFEYDGKRRFVIKTTNPALGTVQTNYNILGKLKNETDITNLTTSYKYNKLGRLTETHTPEGHVIKTAQHWANNDQDAPQNALYYVNIETPGRPNARTYYDILGREVRSRILKFDNKNVYVDKTYNAKGQLYRVSDPYYANDPKKYTTYGYDAYGRSDTIKYQSLVTTTSYNKKVVTITPPDKNKITKTYNAHGDLVVVTDADGGTAIYQYHCSGQVKRISTNGAVFEMTYDKYGRQDTLKDPNAGKIAYEYNKAGYLLKQKDARGKVTTNTYDNLGRIKTQSMTGEPTKSYLYYTSGSGKGQLKSITSSQAELHYEYGDFGRLTKMTEKIVGDQSFITQYDYDQYGNTTDITYPGSFKVKHVYDSKGFLTEIRQASNNGLIWKRLTENAMGQPLTYQMGNNKITTCEYDAYHLPKESSAPGIQNFSYSINPQNGNMNWRKDNLKNLQENFYYDNLNRLDSIKKNNSATPLTLKYLPSGNIQYKSDAGVYNYGDVPVHGVSTISQANTELMNSGNQNIEYTAFHKAKYIDNSNNQHLDILYGVDQQRLRTRLYDNNQLQKTKYFAASYEKETTPRTTREINYITTPYGTLAAYIVESGRGQMYYLYKDHLGSITTITNATGTVVERRSFDAWGRLRNPDNWNYTNIPNMTILERGYTGHEHLFGFGLINMNGRMYDPLIGRFLSPDPYVANTTNTQDFNRYTYARNNPLKYTDPDGEFIHLILGAIIGGTMNWMMNGCQWTWKGLGYFGVGALAGALGAGVGAGISSAMTAGGSFGAGFIGTSTAASTGFIAGAATGAGAGFSSGFVLGAGNAWMGGANFGQGLGQGFKGGLIGGASGALMGGIGGGIRAKRMGLNPWTGIGVGKPSYAEVPAGWTGGDMGGELSGYTWAGEDINITDHTHSQFLGSSDYVSDATIGRGAYKESVGLVGDQLYLGDKRIAGACFPVQEGVFTGVKGSIIISPNASVYAADFHAILGHEVIHAYHYAYGIMDAFGNNVSEYYAHKYSASFPSNYQNAAIQHIQYLRSTTIPWYPAYLTPPIYPSWVPRGLY